MFLKYTNSFSKVRARNFQKRNHSRQGKGVVWWVKMSGNISTHKLGTPAVKQGERWGDYVLYVEECRDRRFLEMPQQEWAELVRNHLQQARNVRAAMRWVDMLETRRKFYIKPRFHEAISYKTECDTLGLYRDLTEEAGKYGSDAEEMLLELDAEIMKTPQAWRLHAYKLLRKDAEELPGKNAAASKIQAAWRGHVVRDECVWTTCGWCMCHGVSTYTVPDSYLVRYHPTRVSYVGFLCKDCCEEAIECLETNGCLPHEL